jgi:hypothetical protein
VEGQHRRQRTPAGHRRRRPEQQPQLGIPALAVIAVVPVLTDQRLRCGEVCQAAQQIVGTLVSLRSRQRDQLLVLAASVLVPFFLFLFGCCHRLTIVIIVVVFAAIVTVVCGQRHAWQRLEPPASHRWQLPTPVGCPLSVGVRIGGIAIPCATLRLGLSNLLAVLFLFLFLRVRVRKTARWDLILLVDCLEKLCLLAAVLGH